MTILGDREQQAAPGKVDTQRLCKEVFGKQAKLLTLKKSYRSTREIMDLANRVAGVEGEEAFERHGKPVEYLLASGETEMVQELMKHLKEGQAAGQDTTAVLTRTWEEAQKLYFALKDHLPVNLLSSESSKMEKGIVITTFYLAKGLEFDSVHLAYVQKETYYSEHHRQIFYIAATRALHELTLYGVGERSELMVETV